MAQKISSVIEKSYDRSWVSCVWTSSSPVKWSIGVAVREVFGDKTGVVWSSGYGIKYTSRIKTKDDDLKNQRMSSRLNQVSRLKFQESRSRFKT